MAVLEAAVEYADGFEERPKIEAAMFRKAGFLLRILLTQRPGDQGARILEKGKKTTDQRCEQQAVVVSLLLFLLNLQTFYKKKYSFVWEAPCAGATFCLTN